MPEEVSVGGHSWGLGNPSRVGISGRILRRGFGWRREFRFECRRIRDVRKRRGQEIAGGFEAASQIGRRA